MKFVFSLTIIVFNLMQSGAGCGKAALQNSGVSNKPTVQKTIEKVKYDRLPENVKPETEARRAVKNEKGEISFEITTVEKRLDELKARYQNDKLVDGNGKEIRFHESLCRGVSRGIEGDEEDRRANENELAALEKKYTVIVLYCDPRKAL